jgi:hypothetical protein
VRTNCEISENRFDSEFMELSTDSKDLTLRLATFHMQDLLSKEGKTRVLLFFYVQAVLKLHIDIKR